MSDAKNSSRSLAGIAGIVAVATVISKLFGLFRQQAIAAAFGVGPAFGAFNFSYVIPGFLLILLGGINGPFHSAIVSVLAKRKREEVAPIVEGITTLVVGILLLVSIGLFCFAEPIMTVVAPGLFISAAEATRSGMTPETFQVLQQTKAIAIQQFQIMAPMATLAGLIGIGFGTLNATNQYWLPSLSPLFTSVTVLIGLGALAWQLGDRISDPQYAMLGGAVLAWSTLAGGLLQWLVQIPAQWKSGLAGLRLRFNFRDPAVKEVINIMGPATFSSGMMQINVWTDLFFASFIPNAAAAVSAMGYAGLLALTPLGIFSNVILVPLLPVFSRLAAPENWPELKQRIRQGMMMTALTMLPLSALLCALSLPLSRVVYERYAFRLEDSVFTATILIAYAVGMFVYLGRDVLVRVFYALEDANTPFRISIVNIFLNAVLDFFLVKPFGAVGLVLATVSVNVISMAVMLAVLNRRLNGLALRQWAGPIVLLALSSGAAGLAAWGTLHGMERLWGSEGFFNLLVQLCIAGAVGLIIYVLLVSRLHLPEVDIFINRVSRRFAKKKNDE